MKNRAAFQPGEQDHRGHHNRAGAPTGAECRRVDAIIKTAQPDKADHSRQRQKAAKQYKGRDDNCQPKRHVLYSFAHSITSPRMRNLASATVDTKPRMPMTSAASK